MTLSTTSALVDDAVRRTRAVAAFNVITLEHAEAIVGGAERAGRGAILQLSENAVRFHGGDPRPLLLACRALAEAAAVPLALHLDHVESIELAETAIASAGEWGLGSIMIDASTHPFDDNVEITARITQLAHAAGLWVEAELGEVGGKDGAHAPGVRTDPDEAAAFVAATGVDCLAVAVGSSHAMTLRDAVVDVALVGRLAATVPVPLVLHGSSGVPDDVIADAVAAGIRKLNVGTALNIAGTGALRAELARHPDRVDPRPALVAARAAMVDTVSHFIGVLG